MSEKDQRLQLANDYGLEALRGLTLVNGGAIVALFTFIGNTGARFDQSSLWWAFACFAAGLTTTLAAKICGYFSHAGSYAEAERTAHWSENLGIFFAILSLVAFVGGSWFALRGVLLEAPEAQVVAQSGERPRSEDDASLPSRVTIDALPYLTDDQMRALQDRGLASPVREDVANTQ